MLENPIVVYKSITVANRAKKLAEKEGIKASIIQLPSTFNIKGCTYAVSVRENKLHEMLNLSKKYKLRVRAYFPDGTAESGVYIKEEKTK